MKKYVAIVVDESKLIEVVEAITHIETAEITAIKTARESVNASRNKQLTTPRNGGEK